MILRRFRLLFRARGKANATGDTVSSNDTPGVLPDAPDGDLRPWIGVDLDGTLALHGGWRGAHTIGAPVPAMILRVRQWIAAGHRVKIMTARASVPACIPPLRDWLAKAGLPRELEITCAKDFLMIELWDDRAVQVAINRGQPVSGSVSRIRSLPAPFPLPGNS
ncbi:hypothetical protein OpiT1DRAFT_03737 [Opitutaceae bacterium TAV1]|nr:hypothetical protein OpiT1DRAFT_03737 [Opitutaceae bacterium TAV1]